MRPEKIKSIVDLFVGKSNTTVEIYVQGQLNVQFNGANIIACDTDNDLILLTTNPKDSKYNHSVWLDADKVSSVNITRIKKDEIFID